MKWFEWCLRYFRIFLSCKSSTVTHTQYQRWEEGLPVRATTPNGKFLPVREVLARLGSFCLPVWIVVSRTSRTGKFDWRLWTSRLDLTSRSGSAFSFWTSRLGSFRVISLKREFYKVKIKSTRWKALKLSLASIKIKFRIPKSIFFFQIRFMRMRLPNLEDPSRSGLKKRHRNFPNGQELPERERTSRLV